MKVILLRDVAKIGRRFEIKEVPDGYALNKLIPQKDAEPATPANVKRVLERQKGSVKTEEEALGLAKRVVASCESQPLAITVEANDQGHLFQAVHISDVVSALGERGFTVDSAHFNFTNPIKTLGEHEVTLKLAGQSFIIPLSVVAK